MIVPGLVLAQDTSDITLIKKGTVLEKLAGVFFHRRPGC